MSAPVDVLAVMDESQRVLGEVYFKYQRKIGPFASQALASTHLLPKARAAVAELIEADKALDAIDSELPCVPEDMPDPMAYLRRRDEALTRRAVALARVQGHQP